MISVLCPSRARAEKLSMSASTLIGLAACPSEVEILVAIDSDDVDAYTNGVAFAGVTGVYVAPERHGYARLSEYWNHLATMASGEWLLLWNDDAAMLTLGWDQIIQNQPPAVLWAYTRGDDAGNYFPAWPAAWTRLLGRICPIPGPHVDTYVQAVGKHLGRIRRIPVELDHHRPDYQHPELEDRTYQEGRLLLGSHGMVPGWDNPDLPRLAAKDAAAIREAGLL